MKDDDGGGGGLNTHHTHEVNYQSIIEVIPHHIDR